MISFKENEKVILLVIKAFFLLIFVLLSVNPIWQYYGEIYGMILGVIVFFGLLIFLIYISKKKLFLNKDHILVNIGIVLLLVITLIFPQLFVINAIENESGIELSKYSVLANEVFHGDDISICWNLTNVYYNKYDSAFHFKNKTIPARNLAKQCVKPVYSPYLYYFIYNFYIYDQGYGKAALLTERGNCGEFSQAIVYMINATMNLPTRSLHFQGQDHELPEILINGSWYVFDRTFTTQSYPVKSEDYAAYIKEKDESFFNNIANIKKIRSDVYLLEEHGFNTTTIEVQLSNWDNLSYEGFIITLYLVDNNSTMPLINQKRLDKEGQCNFSVRSGIKYLFFAEKTNFQSKYIGISELDAINKTESLIIKITRLY